MDGIEQLKALNDQKAIEALDTQRHTDDQVMALQTQEVIAKSFQMLVDYLDKRVSKTVVMNQLHQIGTPDALKVASAVDDLHATLKSHENTDLTEITKVMQEVLDEAKKLPKELPKTPEQKFVDYSTQFKGLVDAVKSVESVVKAQKLIAEAPIVNVPTPNVNVSPPDLRPLQTSIKDVVDAVKKIVIPKYETDNKQVEKLITATNKLLKDILEKPIGRGGGGGGRATPYENSAHEPAFVTLENGRLPTADPTLAVRIDDSSTANTIYIGKASTGAATSSATWQVAKLDTTSGLVKTWADGDANFNNVFDNRTSLTYQ